ncbi:glycoside hydrolase family 92 protein [Dichomitus squalens]|uniref:Glycoside hydrolase family 92 protein n=2 Tax=Dichomitus squalens TaxID=114155 RepID=A0A4Q9NP85_9APHY|nr:glycoside hydrolase family 92 protein [Dichomitus squalens LYAD-421 SS1]EJF59982.1 glycoside hydrolase family 92 protein [Dichomitus squalens LYAD-421 SS1]TBU43320.1 glycoside hydrolase family 92 protein [Dichomitus squalens]TBU53176.1 glycoside hydrolase family 92 protein [Dichomitus squalens]
MGRLLALTFLAVAASARLHSRDAPDAFSKPASKALDYVDPFIGNGGDSPNGSGGMIPSTAPPFAMTRWVAQTRQNYVSVTPYNYTDSSIHGFQGTHQPAIWMGESGQVVVAPGAGTVQPEFEKRGMGFSHTNEIASANYYSVILNAIEGGQIHAEQSATSRVGHLRFTFTDTRTPYVLVEATRPQVVGPNGPTNFTFPHGAITIDPAAREISGRNPERQDFIIGPNPATNWSGYFVARFDQEFTSYGTAQNGTVSEGKTAGEGALLSGFARFKEGTKKVDVRVGVSFISVEQARANLEKEISDGTSLEQTAEQTRTQWAEKLDRIKIEGATQEQAEVFYTGVFHTLQYPYEQEEDGKYYSGYDDQVHEGISYTGYSIWDTFRAEWAWQILLAPERISGMVQSMLQDYKEGGWLPMWKNIVETNVMVGTHADSLVAEAVVKGFKDFDLDTAYEAVHKDATVPPDDDWTTSYFDREQNVGYEVRAGLSSVYASKGWVADDIHSEAASRTLDYAYDDYAVSVLAAALNNTDDAAFFRARAFSAPFSIFNNDTGFMEARNVDGSWAGQDQGWTEGDMWAYTFDVVHDVPALIQRRGGNKSFVEFLDEHFDGGHNDHTNEPSHHIPYLYSLAGAASKSQERIREVAKDNYNNSVNGLSGNEDCGQMSAWYVFSALGFYPVDPVSAEYVVGTPFFDKVTIDLPGAKQPLVITSSGAPKKPYIKSVTVNGRELASPILTHADIANGGHINYEMSSAPQKWSSSTLTQDKRYEHIEL